MCTSKQAHITLFITWDGVLDVSEVRLSCRKLKGHIGDEWVPESRMLKLNEENIAKQKALVESVKAAQEAKNKEHAARKSGGRESSEVLDSNEKKKQKESRGTKRGRDTVEHVSIIRASCPLLTQGSLGGGVRQETRDQNQRPRRAQGASGRRLGVCYEAKPACAIAARSERGSSFG